MPGEDGRSAVSETEPPGAHPTRILIVDRRMVPATIDDPAVLGEITEALQRIGYPKTFADR